MLLFRVRDVRRTNACHITIFIEIMIIYLSTLSVTFSLQLSVSSHLYFEPNKNLSPLKNNKSNYYLTCAVDSYDNVVNRMGHSKYTHSLFHSHTLRCHWRNSLLSFFFLQMKQSSRLFGNFRTIFIVCTMLMTHSIDSIVNVILWSSKNA